VSGEHDIRDLLPGYALGCLDPADQSAVEEHLRSCASCREELGPYVRLVDGMALSVPAVDPPAGLERRVLAAVGSAAPVQGRFARAFSRWPALGAVAAVLVVFLAAGNLLQWTGVLPNRGSRAAGPLFTVALTGVGDARAAFGTVVLDRADSEGVLAVSGLPPLGPGRQYQLWLVRGSERRSAGVFSVDEGGYGSLQLSVPADFRDFRALGISLEPAGGSPAPTGPRVMSGTL
jgi:anti-sigma-K factor RskA